ncbi:MAG: S8 family peptidase [Woeseiaceae bacterium]
MMRQKQSLGLVLALCVLATACTTLTVERSEMAMGIDKTIGAGVSLSDRNVLLITIVDNVHEQLTQGEGVSRDGRLPPLYARLVAQLYRDHGLERIADWPLTSIGVRCLVFATDGVVTESLLQTLRANHLVETAQPMNFFQTSAASEPPYNDPYFELQSGHDQLLIPATHSWSTGQGVVVAVIDTGIDTNHPDLLGRVTGVHNFVDRSSRQFRADVHGTAVAGVIAANANNQIGIVGVAPDAAIMALKACEQNGPGERAATCNSFTLAKAIDFAIDQHADVINLSLAGPNDALLERLVARAVERGSIVVGAVGRDEQSPFPASAHDVIAAANESSANTNASVIRAPGTQIVGPVPGNDYDFFSGSSFSAAYVSGVVALIRQRKPHMSAGVVQELLQITSDKTSGFANACDALSRIVGGGECAQSEKPDSVADTTR